MLWVRNHLINPVVRTLARTPAHRLLGRRLVLLAYTGRRTGRRRELPVMSAPAGDDLVVVVGQHGAKTWWRNFGPTPQDVSVRADGQVKPRAAHLLGAGDPGHAEALAAYRREYPRVEVRADCPVLVLSRPS
jgi:deazaflavin-dependent oxidoreductase (nitroreductase family)